MKGFLFGFSIFALALGAAVGSMFLTANGQGTYAGTGPEAFTANVLQSFESIMANFFPDFFSPVD